MTENMPRCGNCALWEARGAIRARMAEQPFGQGQTYLGTCQLYPPEIVVLRDRSGAEEVVSVWPETHADRWCLEWTQVRGGSGPGGGERGNHVDGTVVHAVERFHRGVAPVGDAAARLSGANEIRVVE